MKLAVSIVDFLGKHEQMEMEPVQSTPDTETAREDLWIVLVVEVQKEVVSVEVVRVVQEVAKVVVADVEVMVEVEVAEEVVMEEEVVVEEEELVVERKEKVLQFQPLLEVQGLCIPQVGKELGEVLVLENPEEKRLVMVA